MSRQLDWVDELQTCWLIGIEKRLGLVKQGLWDLDYRWSNRLHSVTRLRPEARLVSERWPNVAKTVQQRVDSIGRLLMLLTGGITSRWKSRYWRFGACITTGMTSQFLPKIKNLQSSVCITFTVRSLMGAIAIPAIGSVSRVWWTSIGPGKVELRSNHRSRVSPRPAR